VLNFSSLCRILVPASKQLARQYRREAFFKFHNHEGSLEEFGIENKEVQDALHLDDDDDMSVVQELSAGEHVADRGGKVYEGWKGRYSIPIIGCIIRSQKKSVVSILISHRNVKQERDVLFDTVEDARKFCQEVEKQQRLEEDRLEGRLHAALGDIKSLPKHENLSLLIEVVSAYDLPIGDFSSSDPFVIAMVGHEEVHRTKHVSNT
jgi:hypothetical protein